MITGRFWTIGDLCSKLGVSKPRIVALAHHYGWRNPHPGLYTGGSIEDKTTPDAYLAARARADIRGIHNPDWDGSRDLVCQWPGCNAIALQLNGQIICAAGHGYPDKEKKMKKRVVLSTKLLIESGNYRSRAITRQEAADWLAAGPVENYCGHETVRILGLTPDTTRRTCAGYDEALCLSAKSRLDFGKEYSLAEIEAIGVEFTLIARIVTIEDILELARQLPSGLCDEKSPLKLLKELEELEEAASLGDRIGAYLEAADVAYYAAKSIDLATHKAGLAHAVQLVLELAIAKYALRAQPGNPKNDAAERAAVKDIL